MIYSIAALFLVIYLPEDFSSSHNHAHLTI